MRKMVFFTVIMCVMLVFSGCSSTEGSSDNIETETPEVVQLLTDAGLSEAQADIAYEALEKCGINELEKVEHVTEGANDFRIAVCMVNKVWGVNVAFEGDTLYYIEATGVQGSDKTEVYQNMFGAIKTKEVQNITSVDMYYEGEYILKYDPESDKIVAFEE